MVDGAPGSGAAAELAGPLPAIALRVLDESADGVLITDERRPNYPIIYANAGFTRITGYARAEVMGRNCSFMQGEDRAQPEIAVMREALSMGRATTVTLRNYRRDGSAFWNEVRLAPLGHGADGAPLHYVGFQRDVTQRIEAEATLRKARERLEEVEALLGDAVDSMSEAFVICDAADRFVMCNEAYRKIFAEDANLLVPGTPFEDIARALLRRRVLVDALGREEEWFAAHMRQRRANRGATEIQLADGSWILATDRLMKNGGIAGLRIDITALKQTQAALRASEISLDRAQSIAGIGSWELDVASGRYTWSKEVYRIRGGSREDFEPNFKDLPNFVHPDDVADVRDWTADMIVGKDRGTRETRFIRPNGEVRVLRVDGRAVVDPDGVIRRLAGTIQDITDRRLMEQQLAQAQKMEAIGNLTGGMAHDFNNGLGIIIGNLDMLEDEVRSNPIAAELCREAREGAIRCGDLVSRLLAFARRQPLRPQPIAVNTLVASTAEMLRRTLGQAISVKLKLDPALRPALADPTQLEAALVNFGTNARDAMPKGGTLAITTSSAELDDDYVALHPGTEPGRYVLIEVSDTGTGIPPDVIGRIFDPFFTTKAPGHGTGLGLSMVFGFVKQSGGHLTVYSELGLGSTFRVYLPLALLEDPPSPGQPEQQAPLGGAETILVVEDNDQLRSVAVRQLTGLGYRVLEAESARQALRVLAGDDRVSLLLTDVVMPGGMDGVDLARHARDLRPRLRVLLTSGFPRINSLGRPSAPEFHMLAKPFRRADLAFAVRAALADPD